MSQVLLLIDTSKKDPTISFMTNKDKITGEDKTLVMLKTIPVINSARVLKIKKVKNA